MSHLIYNALMSSIPGGKMTPSRWTTFNGPCCVHNGQARPDTKKRSGILFDSDGRTSVSCFNCGFRAGWSPGARFSSKWKRYFEWLGMPSEKIRRLDFDISLLRKNMLEGGGIEQSFVRQASASMVFQSRNLPNLSKPISFWLEENCSDPNFLEVLNYLANRGEDILLSYDYYWTPDTSNNLNQRVIIPFYWENEIVGWTARLVTNEKARRYFSDVQPHYIFNTDSIKEEWEYIFINEGPFDGIADNGVSMLGDKVTAEQIQWLNQTGKTKIVVPDRTNRGGRLIDTALTEGWYVSFPNWDQGIKDAADAVKAYGKLYTIWSIIDARTKNRLEIEVKRQRLK